MLDPSVHSRPPYPEARSAAIRERMIRILVLEFAVLMGVADPWSIVMVPHLLASTSETEIPETDATIQLASARAPASPKRAARGRSIRLLLKMPGCPRR